MTEFSFPWPDTTDPGPQVGDGRPITAEEQAIQWLQLFGAGVLPVGNMLAVTAPDANEIAVNTGEAIVYGRFYRNDASLTLTPASAGAGTTRKDSVILQCDWTGGGGTDQYTVRAITKEGTSGAYPSLTQTANVIWEERLYNYTIDDAGAITGITDARTFSTFRTEITTDMLAAGEAWANDALGATCKRMKGEIIMWSGTLSGHFPVDPDTTALNPNWHLCNGDTQNGVVTPNLADRFVICAGATYAAAATGGAATKNLAHTHAVGTLATGNESAHTHGPGTLATANESAHTHGPGTLNTDTEAAHNHSNPNTSADSVRTSTAATDAGPEVSLATHYHAQGATGTGGAHDHDVDSGATAAGSAHGHAVNSGASAAGSAHNHSTSGATASGGSATQDIMPPYYALAYLCYVGS